MKDPWVADFNALLYSNDKQGGHMVANASDKAFSEFVQIIGGIDIDFKARGMFRVMIRVEIKISENKIGYGNL